MTTIDFLFVDQNGPFLVAMAVTLIIALLELLGLVLGFGLSDLIDDLLPDFGPEVEVDLDVDVDLDADLDLDADVDAEAMDVTHTNIFGQALGWLNVGRVPFLVLLITFLTIFAVIGLIPAIIAGPGAAAAALPVTRQASRLLARIVPREETYAVSEGLFVGEIAKVTMGPVESANPGKAKVTDAHGNIHFLRVRSAKPGERFEPGSEVLLVRHDGPVFEVIAAPDSLTRAL